MTLSNKISNLNIITVSGDYSLVIPSVSSVPEKPKVFNLDCFIATSAVLLATKNVLHSSTVSEESALTKKEDIEVLTFEAGAVTWRSSGGTKESPPRTKGVTKVELTNKTSEPKEVKVTLKYEKINGEDLGWTINGQSEEIRDITIPPNSDIGLLFTPEPPSTNTDSGAKATLIVSDTKNNELWKKEFTHTSNTLGRLGTQEPMSAGLELVIINSQNLKKYPTFNYDFAAWLENRSGYYYNEDGTALKDQPSKELKFELGEIVSEERTTSRKINKIKSTGWKIETNTNTVEAEPLGVGVISAKITPPKDIKPGTYQIYYTFTSINPVSKEEQKSSLQKVVIKIK